MYKRCTCGNNKDVCVDCMKEYIEKLNNKYQSEDENKLYFQENQNRLKKFYCKIIAVDTGKNTIKLQSYRELSGLTAGETVLFETII